MRETSSADVVRGFAGTIAILLPDFHAGGAERVNLDLAHEFARGGHQVEFVLMRAEGELLAEAESAFPVAELGVNRLRKVALALARNLRRRHPDALLAAMWPLTVVAPIAQRISGHRCPVVVSEHSILSAQYKNWGRYHKPLLRLSLAIGHRIADSRVAVSAGVRNDMSRLAWMNPASAHVIHNPVPLRSTPTDEALLEAESLWGVRPGARILSVGSFKAAKNQSLLLRAFARIKAPEARLILLGRGEAESALRILARDLAVENRVRFAGFRHDPTSFYMTADLFVLTSDREGFGNVIVEALHSGTPVVATDCPSGPSEILGNGRWGRLVPVGDVVALAAAMRQALAAEHDRDALRRRAADFAPAIAAQKYLDLLLPGRSPATAARAGST